METRQKKRSFSLPDEDSVDIETGPKVENGQDPIAEVVDVDEEEMVKDWNFMLHQVSTIFDKFHDADNNISVIDFNSIDNARRKKQFQYFLELRDVDNLRSADLGFNVPVDVVLSFLLVAEKHELFSLAEVSFKYIMESMTTSNILTIFETIQKLNIKKLEKPALLFIAINAKKVFEQEAIVQLSRKSWKSILNFRNSTIDELTIFQTLYRWAEYRCQRKEMDRKIGANIREVIGDLIYDLAIPLIPKEDYMTEIVPKKILTPDMTTEVENFMFNSDNESLRQTLRKKMKFRTQERSKTFETKHKDLQLSRTNGIYYWDKIPFRSRSKTH